LVLSHYFHGQYGTSHVQLGPVDLHNVLWENDHCSTLWPKAERAEVRLTGSALVQVTTQPRGLQNQHIPFVDMDIAEKKSRLN